MLLKTIEERFGQYKVVLLQTTSTKMSLLIYDKLRSLCGSAQESIFDFNSQQDRHTIDEIRTIQPVMSNYWLIRVKLTNKNIDSVYNAVKESATSIFFCTVENYGVYKNFIKKFVNAERRYVVDFYISNLNRHDLGYLYGSYAPVTNRLTQDLYNFVVKTYYYDIDTIISVFECLKNGQKFDKRKDILELFGAGVGSVDSFVLELLKDPPNSKRGLDTVIKNRIVSANALAQEVTMTSLYNRMYAAVSTMIDLKLLMISGEVYKNIREVPRGYDEKKLNKYKRYIFLLKKTPLSRLVRLKNCLTLSKSLENFSICGLVYAYYTDLVRGEGVDFSVHDNILALEQEKKAKDKEEKKLAKASKAKSELFAQRAKKYGYFKALEMSKEGKTSDVESESESLDFQAQVKVFKDYMKLIGQ